MAMPLSHKRAPAPVAIPDRLYFKIGDVARICQVETYVLRFWETQFPQLKPNKSGAGQRLYRRREVELALDIKRLVHSEGYTLAGARQALSVVQRRGNPQPRLPLAGADAGARLEEVAAAVGKARAELREIAALLAAPDPHPARGRSRTAAAPVAAESDTLFPA
jgi:DNA-binding transcriptional MerR regulator